YDEGSEAARRHSKQVDMICNTLEQWAIRDVGNRPHKLFLHFFENPAEILGDADGKVIGLRTERTALDGTGNVKGTGEFKDFDVTAIYRAVGYLSQNIPSLPFDDQAGTVPNEAGRVLGNEDADGAERYVPQTYVTGWIKRGPVGLIGHTKGDANETIACLLDDVANFVPAPKPELEAVTEFLEGKGIPFTTWAGWYRLDAHERALGEPEGRERVKVVEREDMLRASEPDKVS
ncbi:pyridine nucleotide-disulfide oxidoreductase, partial [Nocardia sp. NPDC003693]